jgi:DTW domain-containing protein YfiP
MEKLKTVRERERERDVEGLGMRVETCQVCIKREKKILCSCAATAWLKKKKKLIN